MKKLAARILSVLIICGFLLGGFCVLNTPKVFAASKNYTNIGIFVRFADSGTNALMPIDDPQNIANAEKLLNSDAPVNVQISSNITPTASGTIQVPSVKKFYERESYGQVSITTKFANGDQIFLYTDAHNFTYYLPESEQAPDGYKTEQQQYEREGKLVQNALAGVKAQIENSGINGSALDIDRNGSLDLVTLFIEPRNSQKFPVPSGGTFWPHVKQLSSIYSTLILDKFPENYAIIYHGNTVEEYGTFALKNSGYGTIIHELGHLFGFSDLYRAGSAAKPVQYYDVMGQTTTSNPQGFLAFSAADKGWHAPLPEISGTTQNLTVTKPTFADRNERRAVKIKSNLNAKEFFVVEYYEPHDQRSGFAGSGQGIIIYRVNENARDYGNYFGKDFIYVFRSGETALGAAQGNIANAPLNLSRRTFGKAETTQAFDNQTLHFSNGQNSGIVVNVKNLTANSATFDVNFPNDPSAPETPEVPETPTVDETAELAKLNLKKSGNYLFGFALGAVATGQKISYTFGAQTFEYIAVVKGDTTGDGKIQATDYVKIKNHIMGRATLSGAFLEAADIDRNGKILATDYVKIKNHIMGKTPIVQ